MKRILFAMSLSICMAGTINAQQEKMSMKPYENEVRKDTIDTLGVKKEMPEKIICCIPPIPSFPGNIQQFLRAHLVWPAGRKNKKVEGKVIVQFYIERDGTCSQFKILRSLSPAFDTEALRVLKLMPKWNVDSTAKGGTWFVLPVRFKKQKSQL
ncbi:energy transducer TonB [Prevotella melaninogenica]|uniref:energy transducer TonB n=1 Tax=Prevotella melaninogenica TaxID=28132 RepID=UPI0001DDA024|nr:energy transducer TonB [Prevotella melaninogenica]ADK96225.1 TonB family domain protein [Prevotella melaninogenica ATCC 25845]ASE16810.1 energy transducer TonB [Prevotella melaninogenica]UEB07780.1 energy transducer TonB [Prevotella melaninogenica]